MQRVSIHTIKTKVYRTIVARLNGNGWIEITYDVGGDYWNKKVAKLPVLSAWLDPGNPQVMNVCKVYAIIPGGKNKKFKSKEEEEARQFADLIHELDGVRYSSEFNMLLSADMQGFVLRYGSEELYKSRDQSDDSRWGSYHDRTPVYNTKAEALTALIDKIQGQSSGTKITGLDLVNLNSVPDNILEELGYVRVPDVLKHSPPMWYGGGNKLDNVKREVLSSFIDILERSLT